MGVLALSLIVAETLKDRSDQIESNSENIAQLEEVQQSVVKLLARTHTLALRSRHAGLRIRQVVCKVGGLVAVQPQLPFTGETPEGFRLRLKAYSDFLHSLRSIDCERISQFDRAAVLEAQRAVDEVLAQPPAVVLPMPFIPPPFEPGPPVVVPEAEPGPQGEQGPQGEPGETGPQGEPGIIPPIEIPEIPIPEIPPVEVPPGACNLLPVLCGT